ncbi:MAG: amidohydrolase [Acidimicrobiia bacterium]|nr:amidohydrolase [Acidimicrobiia bacterium]
MATLFHNGSIVTMEPGPEPDWLVVDGASVAGVGFGPPPNTEERFDLDGRCLLPGLQDAHVHPPIGGVAMNRCDLHEVQPAAYLETIAAYAAANPDLPWILGGGWAMHDFAGGIARADLLDTVVPDRPALLHGSEGHGAWANSHALRLAGIDASTPDPIDGRIERLPGGAPIGTLQEGAVALVERVTPPTTLAELRAGIVTAQQYLLGHGITGWQDAWVTPQTQAAYIEADSRGELIATAVGAMWWDRGLGIEQIPELVGRSRDSSPRFRPTAVKLMVDGVCENGTASMLEPYESGEGFGIQFITREVLLEAVPRIMEAGLQPHFHGIGDKAIRDALDAVAAGDPIDVARTRPHIAHIQVVDEADVERFGRLGVAANAQALWACNDGCMVDLTKPRLGARARQQYPFRSLIDEGARLACGSDWSVSTADPFAQMAVATTRTHDDSADPFEPQQALTRREALHGFTVGSAWINHREDESGSLRSGKRADLVVVTDNPLAVADLRDVAVTDTFVGGVAV